MPGSRPGLLAERLGLLVQLPVGRPLVGRLAWVWLLLSVRLLRRIRRLPLPMLLLMLAVRIPWRLFIHHALPLTTPDALPSFQGHSKYRACVQKVTDPRSCRYRPARSYADLGGLLCPSILVDHLITLLACQVAMVNR